MFGIQILQEYFKIPFEVFYNVTTGKNAQITIPQFKWQGQGIISMQEIEFYFGIVSSMIEEYFEETIALEQKVKEVPLKDITNINSENDLLGKRFTTGIDRFLNFGVLDVHTINSESVTRYNSSDKNNLFFALFDLSGFDGTTLKEFVIYNSNKIVPTFSAQYNTKNKNIIFTGDEIELLDRKIVEDTKFANQFPHNINDDSIFVDNLIADVYVCDKSYATGRIYVNGEIYNFWAENESAGIAKITEVHRNVSAAYFGEERIEFSYFSSIASRNYDIQVIKEAICLLFGSIVPLELIKPIPNFYNKCKKLQKNTSNLKFLSQAADYHYIYNPFGSLYGQVEAQKLLEELK